MKESVKTTVIDYILIAIGAVIAAFAIEDFLAPNQIFDGGIVGVSMLVARYSGWKLSILSWAFNIPFLAFAWKMKGHRFFIRAVYSMTVFSLAVLLLESTPAVVDDHLLAVTFGGLLLGVGVGLVLRSGGCLDGTEIVATMLCRKIYQPVGRLVLYFNIVLYCVVGFLLGWEQGLYSILTYFLASIIMTKVEEGFDEERGCFIITHDDVNAIKERIYTEMGRTCTEIDSAGLIGGANKTIYVVISKYEMRQMRDIAADFECFIAITEVEEILGKHVKSREFLEYME